MMTFKTHLKYLFKNPLKYYRTWKAWQRWKKSSKHVPFIWNHGNHPSIDEVFMSGPSLIGPTLTKFIYEEQHENEHRSKKALG